MPDWWSDRPDERYWCEVTDRSDLGASLWCPQTNESGQPYWSYGLIREIWPGDIVFHYSTNDRCFQGASVAGGPLEERMVVWEPHGTVGRSKKAARDARPGWWLPVYGYTESPAPLSLAALQAPNEDAWIRDWLKEKGRAKAPIQAYPGALRGGQGYLFKMPREWVERFSPLRDLADGLESQQDALTALAEVLPPREAQPLSAGFKPKDASDYEAVIRGGTQRRSRRHEALVRSAGEFLEARGGIVSTPHPIDLLVEAATPVIIEAKTTRNRPVGFEVRDAIGQLLEYRHFIGPRDAELCILLDQEPSPDLIAFIEETLRIGLAWWTQRGVSGGVWAIEMLAIDGAG